MCQSQMLKVPVVQHERLSMSVGKGKGNLCVWMRWEGKPSKYGYLSLDAMCLCLSVCPCVICGHLNTCIFSGFKVLKSMEIWRDSREWFLNCSLIYIC